MTTVTRRAPHLWTGVEPTDRTFGQFGYQRALTGCVECWALDSELHRPFCPVPEERQAYAVVCSVPGRSWIEHL